MSQRTLRRTCANGHEYTPENTRMRGDGTRICRTCHRESQKAYAAKTAPGSSRQTARYKCSRCTRKLVIEDAHQHSDATLAVMVLREGWVLLPDVLCRLHAAVTEAYAKPVPRRRGPTRTPTPRPR